MNYIDFAVAVLMFLVFFSVILILSTNYFTNISGLTRTSEFRTVAEGLYNLFFGGKGIPENWEETSMSPVQIGLIGDLYRVPVIVIENSGYDRINEIVNVNLIFDNYCENKAWDSTVRVFDENGNEINSKIYNKTFCSSQFLRQARVVWEVNLTADQIKKYYVYYSSDNSILVSNYTSHFSTVGYWKFDDGYGNTTLDFSAFDNDGKLYNDTEWNSQEPTWRSDSDCKSGSCLEFDGANDYIEVPDKISLQLNETYTLELWINPDNLPSWQCLIERGEWGNRYQLWLNNDEISSGENNDDYQTTNANLQVDSWYHIAMIHDGIVDEDYIYLNGSLIHNESGQIENPNDSGVLRIGAPTAYAIGTNHFNGRIDEVRIWNRALSPEEINASYISGPLSTKLFPEEKLDTISSTKIEAMKGLNYEEIIKTIGDYRFRIEISERE